MGRTRLCQQLPQSGAGLDGEQLDVSLGGAAGAVGGGKEGVPRVVRRARTVTQVGSAYRERRSRPRQTDRRQWPCAQQACCRRPPACTSLPRCLSCRSCLLRPPAAARTRAAVATPSCTDSKPSSPCSTARNSATGSASAPNCSAVMALHARTGGCRLTYHACRACRCFAWPMRSPHAVTLG